MWFSKSFDWYGFFQWTIVFGYGVTPNALNRLTPSNPVDNDLEAHVLVCLKRMYYMAEDQILYYNSSLSCPNVIKYQIVIDSWNMGIWLMNYVVFPIYTRITGINYSFGICAAVIASIWYTFRTIVLYAGWIIGLTSQS